MERHGALDTLSRPLSGSAFKPHSPEPHQESTPYIAHKMRFCLLVIMGSLFILSISRTLFSKRTQLTTFTPPVSPAL